MIVVLAQHVSIRCDIRGGSVQEIVKEDGIQVGLIGEDGLTFEYLATRICAVNYWKEVLTTPE